MGRPRKSELEKFKLFFERSVFDVGEKFVTSSKRRLYAKTYARIGARRADIEVRPTVPFKSRASIFEAAARRCSDYWRSLHDWIICEYYWIESGIKDRIQRTGSKRL